MSFKFRRAALSVVGMNLLLATPSHAEATDGEKMLTPNQQRHIVQVNESLPKDIIDQSGDSRRVAELRGHLRETLAAYQQAVKQYGSGKPETRLAAHQVLESQKELHKQFIQEEAIPAVASR